MIASYKLSFNCFKKNYSILVNFEWMESILSKKCFFWPQQIVGEAIEDYALKSMGKAQAEFLDNVLLSGDEKYPIRKNSPHCTFDCNI